MRHYTDEKLKYLASQVTADGLWKYLLANKKYEDSQYVINEILSNE